MPSSDVCKADSHRHSGWIQSLKKPGPFNLDAPENSEETLKSAFSSKILIIGAGGLGCEILKDLALSGFRDLSVIDMDTIDITNLNRQFLFNESNIDEPKANVAASMIMKRIPSTVVTPFYGKIQDKTIEFYKEFKLIICGLDSVEARRWINSTLVAIAKTGDLIPLVDGGSEGLKGQARVIIPTITSCYECSLDMLTPKISYPICTLANTPRLPEHCVEWAYLLEWPRVFLNASVDSFSKQEVFEPLDGKNSNFEPDNIRHIDWLVKRSIERANKFQIPSSSINRFFVQGIVKRIIPAVASTNAIIAASCCNEALKILTESNPFLDNYMMYVGEDGAYTYTFNLEKRSDCPVCGVLSEVYDISASSTVTLKDILDHYSKSYNLQNPSVSTATGTPLYLASPPALQVATSKNLSQPILSITSVDVNLVITDKNLSTSLSVQLREC